MPKFNGRGAITPQIGYCWLDLSRFIYQDCSSGACKIVLSDGTVIAPVGTNLLLANGAGVWAFVEFTGPIEPTQAIYRDSFGRERKNCYPVAIGPDGAIAVTPHSGLSATVLEPDGREWLAPSPAAIRLAGNGKIAWNADGFVRSNYGVASVEPTWDYAVTPEGDLLYQRRADGALVLNGHVIGEPSDKYFYLDVRRIDGKVWVTWSPNQADTNGIVKTFTDAALAQLPAPGAQPTPVPVPVPAPPPAPPVVTPMPTAPNRADVVRQVLEASTDVHPWVDGERGIITDRVVQRLGGLPWGRKDRDRDPNNNNNSDDALCFRLPDGRFEIYDILLGYESERPRVDFASWDYKGTFADGENGYFREVAGVAPPPVVVTPPPVIVTPPAPAFDPAPLLAEIAALKVLIEELERRLDELPAAPDLSKFAKKGDRVTVSGRLSFLGVNRWGGTIDK